MQSRNIKQTIFTFFLFTISSTLFILCWSFSTSPLWPIPYSGDAALFLTLGKYCARGAVPYIDLWDQKGPLVFFIEAIGFLIYDSRYGVFVVQILFMTLTLWCIYSILRLKLSYVQSLVGCVLFLFGLCECYQYGNTVEEFCLPLLTLCLFGFCRWANNAESGQYDHPYLYAFFYGFTGAFCLWTRATNALPVIGGVLAITITLIFKRRWKTLLMNYLSAILGFGILTAPILIYFGLHNAIEDLWFGTVTYNLTYTSNSGMDLLHMGFHTFARLFLCYGNTIVLLIIGMILVFRRTSRVRGLLWIMVSLLLGLWLYRSNGYPHYGQIAAPLFAVIMIELVSLDSTFSKPLKLIPIILYAALQVVTLRYAYLENIKSGLPDETGKSACLLDVVSEIPKEERSSFAAYNCSAGTYLIIGIKPVINDFTMQDWHAENNSEWAQKTHEAYDKADLTWILKRDSYPECGIQDILDEKYTLVHKEQIPYDAYSYELYRHN